MNGEPPPPKWLGLTKKDIDDAERWLRLCVMTGKTLTPIPRLYARLNVIVSALPDDLEPPDDDDPDWLDHL